LHISPGGHATPPSPVGTPPLELVLLGGPPSPNVPLLPPPVLPLLEPPLPLLLPPLLLPLPPLLLKPLPPFDPPHADVQPTLATSAALSVVKTNEYRLIGPSFRSRVASDQCDQ
jgi:hypothetical protein